MIASNDYSDRALARLRHYLILGMVLVVSAGAIPLCRASATTQSVAAAPTTQSWKKMLLPPGVKVIRDLRYADGSATAHLLDLYVPVHATQPRPLLIWVHGGGYSKGDKSPCPAALIVPDGFVVAAVNYRLSTEAPFPAQIFDLKGAVRWLRAHAPEYGIDPHRLGVWGGSSGGHLAALLGTSGDVPKLEGNVGGNLDQSSRFQAVCDWYGPTDMSKIYEEASPDNRFKQHPELSPIALLFGGLDKATPQMLQLANPIAYVTKDNPPFLIMHGDHDNLVPIAQSQLLVDALHHAGVPCEFQIVKGAGHGKGFTLMSAGMKVRSFLIDHLEASAATSPTTTGDQGQ